MDPGKAMQSLADAAEDALEGGDPAKALRLYREAVPLAEAAIDKPALATMLGQMAVAHRRVGDVAAAIASNLAAIELARECGHDLNIARWSGNLGGILYLGNDLAGAEAAYREAAEAAERLGAADQIAVATGHLANMLGAHGRFSEALDSMARARAHAGNDAQLRAILADQERGLLMRHARLLNEAGRLHEAREAIERALALFIEPASSKDEVALWLLRASIDEKEGDAIAASEATRRAAQASEAAGDAAAAHELHDLARRLRG